MFSIAVSAPGRDYALGRDRKIEGLRGYVEGIRQLIGGGLGLRDGIQAPTPLLVMLVMNRDRKVAGDRYAAVIRGPAYITNVIGVIPNTSAILILEI